MITRAVPDLHPLSSKTYWLDWSPQLASGVSISSYDWTVPTGLQQEAVAQSGLKVAVKLSVDGATTGEYYDVVNQVVTSAGDTLHEILRITVSTEGH